MYFKNFDHYCDAEKDLLSAVAFKPDFVTSTTFELIGTQIVLNYPFNNANNRSNYIYAQAFFDWMMTGEKQLSDELIELNPWVKRFVDNTGLPQSFSSSYGWKIKDQLNIIEAELKARSESRRAYVNILYPTDNIILSSKTTMEYPCTIGFQFFIRDEKLHMIVNMRSNNVYSVMPYDVYNMTELQQYMANRLKLHLGKYIHQINNAHMFKGDVRRYKESLINI